MAGGRRCQVFPAMVTVSDQPFPTAPAVMEIDPIFPTAPAEAETAIVSRIALIIPTDPIVLAAETSISTIAQTG
jgi:hypothetical protein